MSQTLQSVLCITTNKYLVRVLVVLLHACFSVVSPIPFLLAAIFFPGHPYIGSTTVLPDTYIHMHAYMIHVRGSPCTSKISHLLLYLSLWLLVPGPSGQCLHSYIQPALISAVFGNMQVYLRTLDRHMCICTL